MIETQLLHASSLIGFLHPTPDASTLVEITGLAKHSRPVKRYFTSVQLAAETAVELNNTGYSAFVSVNPRKAMSAFEADVPFVSALFLDLQPERTSIEQIAEWLTRAGIPPSAIAWSGNGAHMYLKVAPADPAKAKLVWERLCKWTKSDPVHSTNRIARCPGTVNWKSTPRWCYMIALNPERVYTIEEVDARMDAVGAPPARKPTEGIPIQPEAAADWLEIKKRLSEGALDIIATGEKNAFSERQITRSEADWLVVCELVRAGASDAVIHFVYESFPVGDMKYKETGVRYLTKTIESARRATAEKIERGPSKKTPDMPRRNRGSSSEWGRR